MARSLRPSLALFALLTACTVDDDPLAQAEQAVWGGYRLTNLQPSRGTVYYVDPRLLLDSAEAWGPQTLLLAVDRHISPQVTIQRAPGVQIAKDKITRTLQDALGFSMTEEIEFTASSSTVVSEGWYERMEAYPTYQTVAWDLVQDGAFGATKLASGTVYRPMGVYFQTVVLVRGRGQQGAGPVEEPPPQQQPQQPREPQPPQGRQPGSITAIGRPVQGAEVLHD